MDRRSAWSAALQTAVRTNHRHRSQSRPSNAVIRPSLGRDVASCRGAATCNANVNLELIPRGTSYEDRLQQVDLRFSRRFKFGRFNVRANADLSNIFNAGNVYATNTGFGSQWLVPYEIMGGRLVRFTGRLDF